MKRKPGKPQKRALSFQTLLLALLMFIAAAAVSFLLQRFMREDHKRLTAVVQVLSADEETKLIMEDEIAQAGFDPRARDQNRQPTQPFAVAESNQLQILGDFNTDGMLGGEKAGEQPERLIYFFDASSGRLLRNQFPMLTQLANFSFNFVDAQGNTDAAVPGPLLSDVRQIRKVKVRWQPQLAGSKPVEFEVPLRNAH